MTNPGGTLHDAIAEALHQRECGCPCGADPSHFADADAVLAALRDTLAANPEAITELRWRWVAPLAAALAPSEPDDPTTLEERLRRLMAAPPVPAHPGHVTPRRSEPDADVARFGQPDAEPCGETLDHPLQRCTLPAAHAGEHGYLVGGTVAVRWP